ncbi:MAG: lyase family protein [Planctomycetota bacterium]
MEPNGKCPLSWGDRIDKVHEPGYMNWITTAWATMLIKQGIVLAEDAPKAARGVLEVWERPVTEDQMGPHMHGVDRHFINTLGERAGGRLMIARTQPSSQQMLMVRHKLMKQMCRIYDLLEAMLDRAEKHAETIMPGYTHFRHAQPTTFGHYILSAADAIARSTETLEHGYHLMDLCEMGCGALAGTSWPIDRDRVRKYLGMQGLIENANDAVSYTDGYLVVACGLTNVTNIASRVALDISYWSGMEYGFLDAGSHRGTSFMMPQKEGNPNGMEFVRSRAGKMLGHLVGVAAAGQRTPHGDVFEMLHISEPVLAAFETSQICITELATEMHRMRVHADRMLAVIRESYICATELANQIVRDQEVSYQTAHDIVNKFVLASQEQKIPATHARADLLDEAAQKVLGRKLGMAEARLRELLDPTHFIKVTNSRGGAAPDEVARMIADRRQELADARARHLKRIESLENAQQKMLSDLRGLCEA